MTNAEFLAMVEEVLEMEKGSVREDSSLEGLGWDSLAMVSFLAAVDEQCGTVLSPKSVDECRTVADLITLMGEQVAG